MTNFDKWKVIKYIAFSFIALMFVVLTIQFVNLAKLNSENNSKTNQINQLTQELQEKSEFEESLRNSYDRFVEKTAKEDLNMKYSDEEVIVGKTSEND